MTALGRAAVIFGVAFVAAAWVLLTACLTVVAVGVVFDALTGGLTP